MRDTGFQIFLGGFKGSAWVGVLLIAASAQWAQADAVSEAQEASARAYSDFYKALRQNRAPSTKAEASRQAERILAPAEAKLDKAVSESGMTQAKNYIKRLPKPKPDALKIDLSKPGRLTPQSPAPQATRAPVIAPVQDTAPSQPEVILDGSNIPREIEFPGPAPKVSPRR